MKLRGNLWSLLLKIILVRLVKIQFDNTIIYESILIEFEGEYYEKRRNKLF